MWESIKAPSSRFMVVLARLLNNHLMDWDNSKIIAAESNKFKHWIKEAIEIRRVKKHLLKPICLNKRKTHFCM